MKLRSLPFTDLALFGKIVNEHAVRQVQPPFLLLGDVEGDVQVFAAREVFGPAVEEGKEERNGKEQWDFKIHLSKKER